MTAAVLAQLDTVIFSDLMVHRQLNMRGETGTKMDFFPALTWLHEQFKTVLE